MLFESGAYRVMCKHIQLKDNTWYYRRRVPEDVRSLHRDPITKKLRSTLFFSLKTSDKAAAAREADSQTRRLDAFWKAHREGKSVGADPKVSLAKLEAAGLKPGDGERYGDLDPISNFVDDVVGRYEPDEERPKVSAQDQLTLDILFGTDIPRTLSDAREKHFALGKGPKGKVAENQFNRAWTLLLDITGDITLQNLRRAHANEFVARLVKTGVGPETIKRYLSQIRPVIETGLREFEISMDSPFEKLTIPNQDEGPRKPRQSFSMPELEAIQIKCREVDDQRRWAILMLSDTMARLAEVAALRKEDVHLDGSLPYINLRTTNERRLKTAQSARLVPLIGQALWAAKRAMETEGQFLFPVFMQNYRSGGYNSGSDSAALNKWLKDNKLVKEGQTLHSFRHTMRDRLRDVETPSDLADHLGGWKGKGVGESYGQGPSLELKHKYMLKTVRPIET